MITALAFTVAFLNLAISTLNILLLKQHMHAANDDFSDYRDMDNAELDCDIRSLEQFRVNVFIALHAISGALSGLLIVMIIVGH